MFFFDKFLDRFPGPLGNNRQQHESATVHGQSISSCTDAGWYKKHCLWQRRWGNHSCIWKGLRSVNGLEWLQILFLFGFSMVSSDQGQHLPPCFLLQAVGHDVRGWT